MTEAPFEEGALIDSSIKPTPAEKSSGQRTARRAAQMLCSLGEGFVIPSAKQREAILLAFVRAGYVIYGKAFDVVKCKGEVRLDDCDEVLRKLDQLKICEIKSTSKPTVKSGFKGYFCSISTAEVLVAQSLGPRFVFVFVNTRTGEHRENTLREVFGLAKAIYPTWSVAF